VFLNHQNNVAGYAGAHIWLWPLNPIIQEHTQIAVAVAVVLEDIGDVAGTAFLVLSAGSGSRIMKSIEGA
jgi:hypothetical protein